MIFVLEGTQRRQLSYYFERMFRLRHQVFVKEQGWNLPIAHDDREIDQYDVDEAIYLLDITDDDTIQGTVRLTPSESCSLVADYFPHLVENGTPPRSPLVYEATRYIFRPVSKRAHDNRAAKAGLLSAMVEWCHHHEISHIQCVVDMSRFSHWVELVPQTIPLGLPHPYGGGRGAPGGGDCIAFHWPATRDVIDGIRTYGGLSDDDYRLFPGAGAAARSLQLTH
jgi:acyl-homoserine lactone synthase